MKKIIISSIVLMLTSCFALGFYAYHYLFTPIELPKKPYYFTVEKGVSFRHFVQKLENEQIIAHPFIFENFARIDEKRGKMKAGEYVLTENLTPAALLEKITTGDVIQKGVMLVDGWNIKQVRQALDKHPDLKHETTAMTEAALFEKLAIDPNLTQQQFRLEGLLMPETYHFPAGTSDLTILKQAHQALQKKLEKLWNERDPDLPYKNPYEVLIMASLIEKETARGEERPLIAGVFLNRLRLKMKLQTDPTVIYGVGDRYDGKIHKRDLLTDTPYNTYTRFGLPPTPIALPSLAAIEAAVHPKKTDYLYFVAKGQTGYHHFSKTLQEHDAAVRQYILN